MAQRVFLIQMPAAELDQISDAIVGDADQRRDIAGALAKAASPHLHRVTASERVAAASEKGQVSDQWGYARNCMPYLLAATTAEEMCKSLRSLESIGTDAEIEEFFIAQARQLGANPSQLDHHKFAPPKVDVVQAWIHGMLDRSAELRSKALLAQGSSTDDNPVNDYAISTWVWLGRLFARIRPAFWQGRNRWLGGAAFPEAFSSIQTTVMTIGGDKPPEPQKPRFLDRVRGWFGAESASGPATADPGLAKIIAATQDWTRSQMATGTAHDLRSLVESTAVLAPKLAVPNWEESLPKEGGGNLVSGGVKSDQLGPLIAAMRSMKVNQSIPYETGAEWAEVVIAAGLEAQRTGSHLVEGDDSIYGAYRWPAVDES